MKLEEIKGNLFEYTEGRIPVHCISQDCEMGEGIAVYMKKHYKLGRLTAEKFPDCIYYHEVLNLITKKNYNGKPTYLTLEKALVRMKEICIEEGITHLVMPKIGCGLDRLQWPKVREYIQEVFKDTDIDILVCSL